MGMGGVVAEQMPVFLEALVWFLGSGVFLQCCLPTGCAQRHGGRQPPPDHGLPCLQRDVDMAAQDWPVVLLMCCCMVAGEQRPYEAIMAEELLPGAG